MFSLELSILSATVESENGPLEGALKPSVPAARRTEKPRSTRTTTPAMTPSRNGLEKEYFDLETDHISLWRQARRQRTIPHDTKSRPPYSETRTE